MVFNVSILFSVIAAQPGSIFNSMRIGWLPALAGMTDFRATIRAPMSAPVPHSFRFERLRWTSAGLLTVAFMVAFFHRMAPAVLADELRVGFQASAVALGTLSAVYYYVYTLMQIPAGVLADTLGPRRNVAA